MIKLLSFVSMLVMLSGCFPQKAGHRLAHFNVESPAVGDPAPNFTLKDLDQNTVELKQLVGEKPIVLQLGSHTCPVYRYRRFGMSKLYQEYSDKAHFLMVYTLEAHPSDAINPYSDKKWVSSFNYLTNTLIKKHQTEQQRNALANYSKSKLNVAYPYVVDNMNNEIWKAYGRAPSAAFVIDQSGVIALRLPWVDPNKIAQSLDILLSEKYE